MAIDLYCLCWNDARMLPFFFQHYDPFVDRYFISDNGSTDESLAMLQAHPRVHISHFDVTSDSFVDEERRLSDTIWKGSKADWVIVTDIDEHTFHPNLPDYLRACKNAGVTAIQSIGYEMISRSFPRGKRPLLDQVTEGVRSVGHDRLCIFNPQMLTETRYEPGRHKADPSGRVIWPEYPVVLLLHFKQLGPRYVIARSAELLTGLKSRDRDQEWGSHYSWSAAKIRANWRQLKENSGPVPGLGSLRHLAPDKYAEEERVIGRSGLLASAWYFENYPDVADANVDPVLHYCQYGWKEGRRPNPYFDPDWYLETYPALSSIDRNPLFDYITVGEPLDAWPSPNFNTHQYRKENGLGMERSPLLHFLRNAGTGEISPQPHSEPVE